MIPALSASVMGVVVYVVYMVLQMILKINAISTIVSIVFGACAYFVLMLVLKGLNEEDLLAFPGGRKLIVLGRKIHLL